MPPRCSWESRPRWPGRCTASRSAARRGCTPWDCPDWTGRAGPGWPQSLAWAGSAPAKDERSDDGADPGRDTVKAFMPRAAGGGSRRHGRRTGGRMARTRARGEGEAIDEEPARLAELVELGVAVRRRVDAEIAAVSMTHGHSPGSRAKSRETAARALPVRGVEAGQIGATLDDERFSALRSWAARVKLNDPSDHRAAVDAQHLVVRDPDLVIDQQHDAVIGQPAGRAAARRPRPSGRG